MICKLKIDFYDGIENFYSTVILLSQRDRMFIARWVTKYPRRGFIIVKNGSPKNLKSS